MTIIARLIAVGLLAGLAACNTVQGLGRDVQSGGQALTGPRGRPVPALSRDGAARPRCAANRGVSEPLKGVLAMMAACTVWGLSGLFFKALAAVPPGEILSHRVLWTVAFFGVVLAWHRAASPNCAPQPAAPRNWLILA